MMKAGRLLWPSLATIALASCSHANTGESRPADTAPVMTSQIDTFRIAAPSLGTPPRLVRVYLPKGYAATDARYAVLYMQDGQNLFTAGAFGDWEIDETLDRLIDAGRTRGIIVVGVDNSEHRWEEYGPWTNEHMHRWIDSAWAKPTEGGRGDAYVAFIVETLKPEIDRRYRTQADRAHTAIGGSSMGGVIALHTGLTRPDVFSKVMAMSTAIWFAEGGGRWLSANRLLADIGKRSSPRDVRFYLDVGTNERSRDRDPDVTDARGNRLTYPRAYVEGTDAVVDALRRRGVPASNLKHVVDQDAVHHESAWARRFEDAVLWLFR